MLEIDLFTDIICPWCLIGNHRLNKVMRERFPGEMFTVRHHPVLLSPDTPAEGSYLPHVMKARFGGFDPVAMFARPEAEARASGLYVDLSKQLWTYRTQPAHALIAAARDKGTEHALAVAIGRANFLEAKNISEPDVLAEIAVNYGFEHNEARAIVGDLARQRQVEQEAARARASGVRSVPHFVFGGKIAISGGCVEGEIEAAIRQALSAVG